MKVMPQVEEWRFHLRKWDITRTHLRSSLNASKQSPKADHFPGICPMSSGSLFEWMPDSYIWPYHAMVMPYIPQGFIFIPSTDSWQLVTSYVIIASASQHVLWIRYGLTRTYPMQTGSVKVIAYFYVGNGKEMAYFWKCVMQIQILYSLIKWCKKNEENQVEEHCFQFHRCISQYVLFIEAKEYKFQIMITFTHCSLARNSRDVTIKCIHSEKHSDVNRLVVTVFKFMVVSIGSKDYFKL